ncbi:MAG: DegT/DnrJ/EryC1/StrS family aminotransferase [Bacteroidales bacterium]|jgi:dTDP-4-amino-4,6-dideoxygalactose transaminase|nr:DegT/DnrJ/EryC1/StrS family aminotransferase [Bacteroidales bacterium]
MSKKTTFVTQPYLPPLEEFIPYLEEIWQNKWLTNNGQFHQQLEQALCDYLGIKHISLFSNGTLALITALQTNKINGEVITTPFSFVASTHSLWWNGIKPVFCDIEPNTFNIDPDKIESLITPATTAIMPVHVYGNPCNVHKIKEIADTYGLQLIYDACHAFAVEINGESICNWGDLSVLSFHATKVYNTFEGGAIVSHDEKTKKRIDYLKNFGFAGETRVIAPGINAKMNEVQAAFGLLQLKYVDQAIEKRKNIAEMYRENLAGRDGLILLNDFPNVKHNYAYFPVLIRKNEYGKSRDEVYELLKKNNIYSRRYFYPLISQFPVYNSLESASIRNLPVATKIAEQVLCLPIYPELSLSTVEDICSLLNR